MTKRKTPPYLAEAAELYRNNRKPDNSIFIHIGRGAWNEAANRQESGNRHSCLPDNEDPAAYKWPVLMNDVIVKLWSQVEGVVVRSLVECLLRDGATMVIVMQPDHKSAFFYPGDL